jgi:hypothetical protein
VRVWARRLHDGGGVGRSGRQRVKGNHRRRGAREALGVTARPVCVPINQDYQQKVQVRDPVLS